MVRVVAVLLLLLLAQIKFHRIQHFSLIDNILQMI